MLAVLLLLGGVSQAKGQQAAGSQAAESGGWNVSKYADNSTFPSSGSLLLGWDYSRCTWMAHLSASEASVHSLFPDLA